MTTEWIVGLAALLALVVLVIVVVVFRGRAQGEAKVGPVWAKVAGSRGAKAKISDAVSKSGGATARGTGDAEITRVEVDKDLTAEAGLPTDHEHHPKDS
jgi:hypothetical protein